MKRFLFIHLIILALSGQGCRKPLSDSVVIQAEPDQQGLDVIKAEVDRLQRERPLTGKVHVWVIGDYVTGWYRPPGTTDVHLIRVRNGPVETMIRALRHEWEHALQHCRGRLNGEAEARTAEGG